MSVVQNLSGDVLDGVAEPHYLTDDAGDRAGSLDDDEQCAAGAARRALALLARLVGVDGSGGSPGLGWSAAFSASSDACMELLRKQSRVRRRVLPARCRSPPRTGRANINRWTA